MTKELAGELYTSVYSPYVHRVLAVGRAVGVQFKREEIDLASKPDDFLRLSPNGKVPMLNRNDRDVLYESSIIATWLAEEAGWDQALPGDRFWRNRHRLAIQQWDAVVVEAFLAGIRDDRDLVEMRGEVMGELDRLEEIIRRNEPEPRSLLGLCLAPFWLRFQWLDEELTLTDWFQGYDILKPWLNQIINLEPVRLSAPDRYLTRRHMARQGLIPDANEGSPD